MKHNKTMESSLVPQRGWSCLFYSNGRIYISTGIHRKWEFLLLIPFPTVTAHKHCSQAGSANLACDVSVQGRLEPADLTGEWGSEGGMQTQSRSWESRGCAAPMCLTWAPSTGSIRAMQSMGDLLQHLKASWGCEEHQPGTLWLCGHFGTKPLLIAYRSFYLGIIPVQTSSGFICTFFKGYWLGRQKRDVPQPSTVKISPAAFPLCSVMHCQLPSFPPWEPQLVLHIQLLLQALCFNQPLLHSAAWKRPWVSLGILGHLWELKVIKFSFTSSVILLELMFSNWCEHLPQRVPAE